MRIGLLLASASLVIGAATAQAEEPEAPLVLEPSSQWHVNYADDSCRLLRTFGEGEERSVLYMERYQPGDGFYLLVAGKPFRGSERARSRVQFGPNGTISDEERQFGEFGEFGPALMAGGMTLLPLPEVEAEDRADIREDQSSPMRPMRGQTLTADQEAQIEWLEIQRGGRTPVRLKLGSMKAAMEAMRGCTDELLTHWGIDLEAHRTLTSWPKPIGSPGQWITSRDYPRDLLARGAQGVVQFRLTVGREGKPLQCHVQQSTRPEGFDEAVCKAMMRRAEFEPALDAEGKPIVSYWRTSVRFEMPD